MQVGLVLHVLLLVYIVFDVHLRSGGLVCLDSPFDRPVAVSQQREVPYTPQQL